MSGRIETKLARRRFLKGAGGVAIALPLFWGRERALHAATAAATPERFLSVYFGNGLPSDLTGSGLAYSPSPGLTPLGPLVPFANELTIVRGINGVAKDAGATGHMPGSGTFCCAQDISADAYDKGGPSLDWVAYQYFQSLAPQVPMTPLPVVAAGVYGKNTGKPETLRWTHCWKGGLDPKNAIPPFHDPLMLFHQLFGGTAPPPAGGTAPAGLARYRQSVLDAVTAEYKQITGPASPYPASVRTLIGVHLDTIRTLELQAAALSSKMSGASAACKGPAAPASMDSQANETLANYQAIWPVMLDIYLLGLTCDLFRFGNVLATMGGDVYPATFMGKSATNVHGQWFHNYPSFRPQVGSVINWEMQMVAQVLDKMSKIPDPQDPAGKTLLSNTTVLIGTELSEPETHSRQGMTFFLAGAKGRFKGGTQNVSSRSDTDFYNTVLQSMGLPPSTSFGKAGTFSGVLSI
ncbi:MAG: DUF1552 domain-containing protein [Myxococcota bacterium]|nr:DUF1552 domain-containing protein [Myxococcota bacterium]